MKEWLVSISEQSIIVIDGMALLVILVGTAHTLVRSVMVLFSANAPWNEIWIAYARWLVAGLTFQLAADVIESSIATDWESLVRLATVAVIRTFLNYFLDRDLVEARERATQEHLDGGIAMSKQ